MRTVLLLFVFSIAAKAQSMTIKDYREMKTRLTRCKSDPRCSANPDFSTANSAFGTYLQGMGDGFFWVNGDLKAHGKQLLYCQPEKLTLGVDNYAQVLESYLPTLEKNIKSSSQKGWKTVDDVPLGFALLQALQDAFPCQGAPAK